MNRKNFRGKRITRTAEFNVRGPLEDIYPLFGPVEEMKWARGWNPEIIYPAGKKVAEKMVFRVAHDNPHSGMETLIWVISRYVPEKFFIEYTVFARDRVWWISVQCRDLKNNEGTGVTVTYTYTGLTEEGHNLCIHHMKKIFAHHLKDWETAINDYLNTGKTI